MNTEEQAIPTSEGESGEDRSKSQGFMKCHDCVLAEFPIKKLLLRNQYLV